MVIVRKLTPEQFDRLGGIFRTEFDSDPPLIKNSEIYGAFEDGKMVAFVLCEKIVMLGQIYVVPEKRNNSSRFVQKMLSFLRDRYDNREVVGAVASESRFENLFKAFGMQGIQGKFFRKNISS